MIKRNLPLMITIGVFVLGYFYCLTQFPGFASTRVICNILTDNAFLGIIAVGMTFMIRVFTPAFFAARMLIPTAS
ncbi:hypothetical protein ACUOFC_11965, partial [Escherichia sp. TWPC-MK]